MGKTYRANDYAKKRALAIREYRQLMRNLRGRGETITAEYQDICAQWTTKAQDLKREYAL